MLPNSLIVALHGHKPKPTWIEPDINENLVWCIYILAPFLVTPLLLINARLVLSSI